VEALLLPWAVSGGGPSGTLWVVAYSDRRKFDRAMSCLAAFASGGIRLKHTLLESERAIAASQVVAAMAHHINNPLQGAIGALCCLNSLQDLGADARALILIVDSELRRVANLSRELLRKAR
jgi:signal transduction histidine kinase